MTVEDPLVLALALAARGEPRTSPNPTVGCVLVRDGEVVGAGVTEPAGGAHAEVVALAVAGERARGATAYVTLEPCDHTGRTGPCSVALLEAGIARLVHAHTDPVPGHGGGAQRLRDAGVEVEHRALDGWEGALTERFLTRARTHRPWVTCKLAATRAGSTIPDAGRWITGEIARHRVHAGRARADGVLVGVGTVLVDDPRLDVRHVTPTRGQPRPVVLDSRGRTPPDSTVAHRGALVLVTSAASPGSARLLRAAGAEVVEVAADADGRVELPEALQLLAEHGLHELYAEPGETLASALVVAGLVDELVVHRPRAPRGAGDQLPAPWHAGRWTHVRSLVLGEDREDAFRPLEG